MRILIGKVDWKNPPKELLFVINPITGKVEKIRDENLQEDLRIKSPFLELFVWGSETVDLNFGEPPYLEYERVRDKSEYENQNVHRFLKYRLSGPD